MSTWTEDSRELFIDLHNEFGALMMYFPGGAYPIRCVKTPLDMSYEDRSERRDQTRRHAD